MAESSPMVGEFPVLECGILEEIFISVADNSQIVADKSPRLDNSKKINPPTDDSLSSRSSQT